MDKSKSDKINIPDGPTDGKAGVQTPAAQPASAGVAIGDIVLYTVQPTISADFTPPLRQVPMIVTALNSDADRSINGVAFSDDAHLGFEGGKRAKNVPRGEGAGRWLPRP